MPSVRRPLIGGDMLKSVYDPDGDGRIEKDALKVTLNKILKGAGAGANPTEIAVPIPLASLVSTVCSETEADTKIAAYRKTFAKQETRDMTAASGAVTYTGYGFQPVALIIIAYVDAHRVSIGSAGAILAAHSLYDEGAGVLAGFAGIVYLGNDSIHQSASSVITFNADGFILNWTKTGAPAGTAILHCYAFR